MRKLKKSIDLKVAGSAKPMVQNDRQLRIVLLDLGLPPAKSKSKVVLP